MKMRLVATTAIAVALAAPAFAQSRDKQPADTKAPPAQAQHNNAPGSTAAPPASSSSQNNQTGSGTGQSAGSTAPPASNSTTTSQAPASGNNASQAQSAPPSSGQPSTQQSANPPPANSSQAQQAPAAGTTAQQPNPPANTAQQQPANTGTANQQPSTAQSSQTNVNANVQINDEQRTRISQSITRLDVKPLTNVNFSISVGTVVPRDVRLATLPPDVIEIVPQYRGYSFFVVRDEIVIVEPSSYKIVATLPYSGSSAAAAPARERSKTTFSNRDREVIRKHTRSARPEGRTTGSTARTDIRVGQRLPESVEIEEFPETVYRDAPALREYRYIHRENRTYMIEPRERMVIEEID